MKGNRKQRFKIGAAALLTLSLTVNLPLPRALAADEAPQADPTAVTVSVYPTPHSVDYLSTDGMKFEGKVNVVLKGTGLEAAGVKLEGILEEEGIDYEISDAEKAGQASILLTSNKAEVSDLAGDAALTKSEGYVLSATDDVNKKGNITIVGADEDGAYWGVMTLKQLLKQKTADGLFAEVKISDYPNIGMRGFIEGFYGYPWSFDDRKSLVADSSLYKANTYIYAPKDDIYHRASWRTLYPDDQAQQLKELVDVCHANNVNFCWSIHPGEGYNYNNDTDFNYMIAKFEQLYKLGVRQFGISYDDLGTYPSTGKTHADVINRVNKEFVQAKGDVEPLIVVACRYCNAWGADVYSYLTPFLTTLDSDVIVMWTGASTMSAITKEAFEWPKTQTGTSRNMAVWWNYPVNDYCDGKLMMAPLENVDNDVDNIEGLFLNPMSQADASKVSIFSGADWAWNYTDFEKMSSWKRAIEELVPEASEAFQRFADNISYVKDGFEFDESRYLIDKLAAFDKALSDGSGISEAAQALKEEFETMKADVTKLRALDNKNLQEEINPFVNAYEALAEAGIAGMDGFLSAEKADIKQTLADISEMNTKLAKANTFTVTSLETNTEKENKVDVGEKRLKPLLSLAAGQIQNVLNLSLNPPKKCSVFSSEKTLNDTPVILDSGSYKIKNLNGTLEKDGYIGFNLPKAVKLSSISLTSAQKESLEIQYSLNNVNWTPLTGSGPVDAAFVRVVNKSNGNLDISISEFAASVLYSIGTVTATTDLSQYQDYAISNAVDGNMATKFYSSAPSTAGSYIRVDLGGEIPLFDVKICYGSNPKGDGGDDFATTKLEISTDAVTWRQIGDVIPEAQYVSETIDGQAVTTVSFDANGEMARYVRFSATEGSEKWAQVCEVLYNQNNGSSFNDNTVTLAESNFTVSNLKNLYDSDLTTFATATAAADGNYIEYQVTDINASSLIIVQDAANICGAKVKVMDLNQQWSEIGTLQEEVNTFDVNKAILKVRLEFLSGKPAPKLYELIVKATDISSLEQLVASAKEVEESSVGPLSWAALQEALKEAEQAVQDANEGKITQEEVNAVLKKLEEAYNALKPALPFEDVKENEWWYDSITEAYKNNLMTGLNEKQFAPGQNVVRAQFAKILHRINDEPEITYTPTFPDVPETFWGAPSILWANSIGVVNGYTNTGCFGPTDNITREQIATMLYRYAKDYKKLNVSQTTDLSKFQDEDKITSFAKEAMIWAVANNIITGKQNGTLLEPGNFASRAECATMVERYVERFGK